MALSWIMVANREHTADYRSVGDLRIQAHGASCIGAMLPDRRLSGCFPSRPFFLGGLGRFRGWEALRKFFP